MERIEKYVLLGAEMGQFRETMIDTDQQAEDQPEDEEGDIETGLGVGGGQEFLHCGLNLRPKIIYAADFSP